MSYLNRSNLAILIPALNESKTIAEVVLNAITIGIPIVIDDCSSDNTAELAKKNGAQVLELSFNHGYEGALSAGFEFAISQQFEFVLTMDADGQHSIESANLVINSMSSDIDIVIGTRLHKQRFLEYIGGWVGSLLWKVNDPFSGLKLYRLNTCKNVCSFDENKLAGTEMMVKCHKMKLNLTTIDIITNLRNDESRFGSGFFINFKLFKILLKLIKIHFINNACRYY